MNTTIKARNRILSLALAICLLLGMTLYIPGPITASAINLGVSGSLTAGDTVYFGSAGTTYTTDNTNPGMGWVVLEVDNGEAWLFAEDVLYKDNSILWKEFQSSGQPSADLDAQYANQWKYSELCEWLNRDFYTAAFTAGEKRAVNDHTYETEVYVNSRTNNLLTEGPEQHTTPLFLLDLEDVQNNGAAVGHLEASVAWWLRSPGGGDGDGGNIDPGRSAAFVSDCGNVSADGSDVYNNLGIRPAFRLNLESVIFTSDASGASAKSTVGVANTLSSALAPTGDVKLTVVDSGLSVNIQNVNVSGTGSGGDTVTFAYNNITGTPNSLSVIVRSKSSGVVTHYGRLANDPTNGNATVTLPTGFDPSTHTLEIFVEQINGDYVTDYASQPEVLNLTPDTPLTNAMIEAIPDQTYTGSAIEPTLTVKDGNTTLVEDTDYTVAYFNNTNIGTATAIITAVANSGYTGTASADFEIVAGAAQEYSININSMTNGSVTVDGGLTQAAQGTEIYLTVTPDSGYRLQNGTLKYNNTPITGTSFTMPEEDVTISAQFGPVPNTPSVSIDSLTIPKGETRDFVVYLGNGPDAADEATVTSGNPSVATVSPDTVNTDGTTVTVTGVAKGNATISLGWSGGSLSGTSDTVNVEVTDDSGGEPGPGPDDNTHRVTVTANPAEGGNPVATPTNATPTQIVELDAGTYPGWRFDSWSGGVSFDNASAEQTTFTMPDREVTITANYTKTGGGGDPGPTDPETPGGGTSSGSTRSGRSGSSSGGSTYTPPPKTTLPASAFTWDGRTLTIDHDSITPLGLLSVQWDNIPLTRSTDYGVYQGSVIVHFGEDFMAAQAPGDHTVRVEFLNHTGETTVTVGGEPTLATEPNDDLFTGDTHNPNTGGYPDGYAGDNPNTGDGRGIWLALLLGCLGAAVMVKLRPSLRIKN